MPLRTEMTPEQERALFESLRKHMAQQSGHRR